MHLNKGTCTFVLITLFISSMCMAADRTIEINNFMTQLSSSNSKARIDVTKLITRSGLSDTQLFDLIQEKLLDGYSIDKGSLHLDEMAWYCKALASSGLEKYRSTLVKVANEASSSKVRKYAKQSQDLINDYRERNAAINSTKHSNLNLSEKAARIYNMLQSDNLRLQKDAAKMLFRGEASDMVLFDSVQQNLEINYKQYIAKTACKWDLTDYI